jgi:hypothetical protein
MQSVRPPQATPHSSHDLVLLAAATDRDADPTTRSAAADQVAACAECAALAAELRSLALGLAHLPASRPVPRDMRITAEQAARLRRGGLWRRLLRPFSAEGLPSLRPLAAALTTLGLAGILLTALPLGFGSGGAALVDPRLDTVGNAVDGRSTAAPAAAPAASGAAEQHGLDGKGYNASAGPSAAAAPGSATSGPGTGDTAERSSAAPHAGLPNTAPQLSPLAWVSLGLVGFGLGLFALLFVARRIA